MTLLVFAALLLSNTALNAWGLLDDVILQGNCLVTIYKDVSDELVERSVLPPVVKNVVQRYLDKAVVQQKVTRSWDHLKTVLPKTVRETTTLQGEKRVTVLKTNAITLGQTLQFVQFYPLLYGHEKIATRFEVPIGSDYYTLKVANKGEGTFSLSALRSDEDNSEVDLSNLQDPVTTLSDSKLKKALRETLEDVSLRALDATLDSQPDFNQELREKDKKEEVTSDERDKAFRAYQDIMVATAVQKNKLDGLTDPPSDWLKTNIGDIDSKMRKVREQISKEIAAEEETKLKFELTQSLLQAGMR